ncbi:MAG: AEC family transporter [Oscillospiraceae bacterium]|nr:AEC family transporter [Oscillospiraceae bacterium]
MALTSVTAYKTVEMVILALLGVVSFKCGIVDEQLNKKLSNLVLSVFTPILLFISLQKTISQELLHGLLISALLAVLSFLVIWFISKLTVMKQSRDHAIVEHISLMYSNCGFIGIPMAQGIWGTDGVFYMTAYVALANFLLWTHGVIMFSGKKDFKSVEKVFRSPTIIAIVLGLIFFLIQLELPKIVREPMEMIASVNTPMAMMVAGINIAQADLRQVFIKLRTYFICFIKLIIMPLSLIYILSFIPVDQTIKTVIVLACACPSGVTGSLFALKFDKDAIYASEIFAMTTILSIVTVPFMMIFCS